jgi:hypothetical protein
MFHSAQHDNYFESNSRNRGIQPSKPIMNNQQTTDKAGTSQRLRIMKNEAQSIYGILAGAEEKGRGAMETAVYTTCILSVVVAIFQFIGQPTPDPFVGYDSAARPAPVAVHSAQAKWDSRS